MKLGRKLAIGPTDNTSDQRTPRQHLHVIPAQARLSFAPYCGLLPGLALHESDMTRLGPDRPVAQGQVIEVTGRVSDAYGRPQRGVMLEIWSANTFGRYTHAEDNSGLELDPHFLGQGRVVTDETGAYRFWTVKPGAYLARPDIGRWRPKHIHMSLRGGATRLVTQMYFPDDPYNDSDPMRIVMGDAFGRNLARVYSPDHPTAQEGYRFDIVVGGLATTLFE